MMLHLIPVKWETMSKVWGVNSYSFLHPNETVFIRGRKDGSFKIPHKNTPIYTAIEVLRSTAKYKIHWIEGVDKKIKESLKNNI